MAPPFLAFASPLLTLAHPALLIKQPCSPFRIETDFVQVIILDKQLAVLYPQHIPQVHPASPPPGRILLCLFHAPLFGPPFLL